MKEQSILREVSIKGKGLHSGEEATLTLKPAPEGHGIVFRRTDIYGKPHVRLSPTGTTDDLIRQTSLSDGNAQVHTPEHLLSALCGLGIDNVEVDLDGKEVPILDGSAKHYANLIQQAEPVEQEKERDYITLKEPVSVTNGASSVIALPYDGLKITCTSADDRGIHTQHLSLDISSENYFSGIAPARTFTIYEDIEPLLKMGKIQGGSLDCAIVLRGDKVMSKEPLRFQDELVRHKILDMVGDLALLGKPLKAHIVAVRPGHALNNKLVRKIAEQIEESQKGKKPDEAEEKLPQSQRKIVRAEETALSTRRILDIMPHAYPFVLIDRVISFGEDDSLVAIKNVTINEPFFQGHFPGNPVMPGVLQLEAMAQAAGIIMLRKVSSDGKLALFMSADKVKFRKAVFPGDQLEIKVKLTKTRGKTLAYAHADCSVDGKIVSSADLAFTLMDAPE